MACLLLRGLILRVYLLLNCIILYLGLFFGFSPDSLNALIEQVTKQVGVLKIFGLLFLDGLIKGSEPGSGAFPCGVYPSKNTRSNSKPSVPRAIKWHCCIWIESVKFCRSV
jgi:hypothetical protein